MSLQVSKIVLFVCLMVPCVCLAQDVKNDYVQIGMKANSMMYSRDYSRVRPETKQNCHGRGSYRIHVWVSVDGNVDKAESMSELCKELNEEVLESVRLWTFRRHFVDDNSVKFRGVIIVRVLWGQLDAESN